MHGPYCKADELSTIIMQPIEDVLKVIPKGNPV